MQIQTYPTECYYQRDPLWGNLRINKTSSTMNLFGCHVVSRANILKIRPDKFLKMLHDLKQFTGNTAMAATRDISMFTRSDGMRFSSKTSIPYPADVPIPDLEVLLNHLLVPAPAMVEVDINLSQSGQQMHFVTAIGAIINSIDLKLSNIIIQDPWLGITTTLLPIYGANLQKAIYSYTRYFEV